jgi:hypothetical protein
MAGGSDWGLIEALFYKELACISNEVSNRSVPLK